MNKFRPPPPSSYSASQQASSQPHLQAITANMLKSVFPNGDPNFFIPSFRTTQTDNQQAEPYANNVWVYAACHAIATNLSPLPKVLDVASTPEKEVIDKHQILSLLNIPNPLMDGPTFWENIILDLMLPTPTSKGGQCFLLAESLNDRPVNLRKGEIPKELYPFSDQYITPILDKSDGITLLGWSFKPDPTKNAILYKPEEVIRIFLVDPMNPLKGQSPVWAARLGIRQDFKAQLLNERFFDNNASLGGVLETDAELEGQAGKELRESFEERYAGQENAGRVALLHSGVKYHMFQQSHQDMQFLEQRKWTREEILAAYGVPKFNVGVYEDINFATAKAADKSFWQNTLVPLDQRILRAFTNQWVQYTDSTQYKLASDYTNVIALAPDLTEKLDQAQKMAAMQIPVAEINNRLELKLNIDSYPWLQTALVQSTLVPAERTLEEPEPFEEEEAGMEPTSSTAKQNPEKSVMRKLKELKELSDKAEVIALQKKDYTDNVLMPDEKRFHKELNTYLKQQRNLILDMIDAQQKAIAIPLSTKEMNPEDIDGLKKAEDKRIQKMALSEYIKMAKREAIVLDKELASTEGWSITSQSMKKVFAQRVKQIKAINTTTFKYARNAISEATEQALSEGLSHSATTKLIKKAVNEVYNGRINSNTIARTETNSIHSQTRFDVYKSNGITKIKWMTIQDDRVRGADDKAEFPHDMLDGTITTIKEGFNNGEPIRYPLDPKASASNVINCRCFITSDTEA